MRDLFDEFMDELRRRQAAASDQVAGGSANRPDGGAPQGPQEASADDASDEVPPTPPSGPGATEALADAPPEEELDDASLDERDDVPPGPRPTPIDDRPRRPRGLRGPRERRPTGGGGSRPPGGPDDGAGRSHRGGGRRIGLAVLVVAILLVLALGGTTVTFWTDAIWFRSVGFESVFWTRVLTQLGLFVGTLVVALVLLLGGLWLADRGVPRSTGRGGAGSLFDRLAEAMRTMEERSMEARVANARRYGGRLGDDPRFERFDPRAAGGRGPGGPRPVVIDGDEMPELTPILRIVLVVIAVLFALGIAGTVAGRWETIQLWAHQVPYAVAGAPPVTDPVFGRDIGFFLFQLPFIRLLQSVATTLLVGSLILAGARYAVGLVEAGLQLTTRVRVHLAVLGGLLLILIAVGYQLDKLELVYSNRGVATGVSYTDAHAQFLAFDVLTVIAALAGAFLVGAAFTRWVWPLGFAVASWLVASFVLGTVYPALVQQFSVLPNQYAQEQPYIANNIAMTRLAFGLSAWSPTPFDGAAPLTQAKVTAESATFQNARLWDKVPLGDALGQLQTIRQYYAFTDVDTDRYTIDGQLRQVMLSARELAPEKNPQANSWVNQRITFTHGVGVAMVPVNQATPAGQPDLIIKDLPPVSVSGAPAIAQPRIYFGERPSDYVIVDAKQAAFDYPVGSTTSATDGTAAPPWTGTSGIRLDTTLARALFAIRFGDVNLLISDQVTGDSQLLFHRSLNDRLGLIAPFLRFDQDPYLVISGGNLFYVQDAYTISDRFPNAQSFDGSTLGSTSGLAGDSFNYIRNSVKIVMNAYDGSMTFYVADPTDPIVRAYEGIFPGLFTPLASMPADLQAHLRVPEDLFNVETNQFAKYHVTDTAAFYSNSDLWTVPANPGGSQSLPTEAYYVVMRLPDQPKAEFLLLQPMVPKSRPNMIAWIAARNDGSNRGQVLVYQFPQDTSVLGPNQIEAKIDAEPTISSQVSLWDQAGSKVIKGNLIVIPLQDSLIYLQPIYLQSANAAFPQLQKVVLATSTTVVWGDTLDQALRLLLAGGFPGSNGAAGGGSGGPSASPGPGASPGPTASPGPGQALPADVQALVGYANLHFERAQAALRAGDFATYGSEIALVRDALARLATLTGGSPAPSSTAAPTSSPAAPSSGASLAP